MQGSPRGLFAPCRHHQLWVKTPQPCSWDRHAKFKHFPSVNTPPTVPFLGAPSPPLRRCHCLSWAGLRDRCHQDCPHAGATSASRPAGVVREEGTESSGLLQVPLGLFLFNLHSLGQRSRSSPGLPSVVLECLGGSAQRAGFCPSLGGEKAMAEGARSLPSSVLPQPRDRLCFSCIVIFN